MVQSQINLARYPQETAKILQRDIFWFFLKDEDFVLKTINYSNIDLDKFPANKVRKLAKKLESSKSTAKHIKQVSDEPQAAKVNVLRHQCTELPQNKFQRKQRRFKPKQYNSRNQQEHHQYDRTNERIPQAKRKLRQNQTNTDDQCTRCGDTPHMQGFRCPASRHQCKYCKKIGHFSHMCFRKPQEQTYKKEPHKPQAQQIHVGRYSLINQQCDQEDTSKSEESFCLQMQIKPAQADQESCETQQLFTHLEYKLKYYRKSTKFLRARIDTCSNANVMPASIYKKIFKDPECSKLMPIQLRGIYTYTMEKIPVIGSCELLVLHPYDKCFIQVPFHVVSVEGSVIVSCATSIKLKLIHIHNELDTNIPDCARLYYSLVDKPRANQVQEKVVDHTANSDKNCQ